MCMYSRVYVCVWVWVCIWVWVCVWVWVYVSAGGCAGVWGLCVCVCVYVSKCVYGHLYVMP